MADVQAWMIEQKEDGVLLVRIPSENRNGKTLPDAVFSFRKGDPQFALWESRWQEQCAQSNS